MQAPYIDCLQVIDPSFETFASINVTSVFPSFDPGWPGVSELLLWFLSSWSGSFVILSGQWPVDSWSLPYMINLANISPTSFLTEMRHYFTSERDLLTISSEACHPRHDFSLSSLTARLCQSSSESSLDLEGKSHSGAHSLIAFIVCLSKWVKNSLVFFFLPNLLCVGDVTSRQPHTCISGELGIYWDFTGRILVSATFNWKKERSVQAVLGGGMQRDVIFKTGACKLIWEKIKRWVMVRDEQQCLRKGFIFWNDFLWGCLLCFSFTIAF